MGFETLLGNERLKENLTGSLSRGRVSHFYLISGPEGSGKHTLAKLLAAAILCQREGKPCGVCNPCRKVMEDNHPDVITVVDPEHKNVAVKIVREIREDVFIRPNESDYKIYIFPQELGIEGQNALLKILEEPPKHGVFILLADTPEKLLPTVRSRCTELNLTGLSPDVMRKQLRQDFPNVSVEDLQGVIARSGGFLGQARKILEEGDAISPQTEGFAESYSRRDALGLAQVLVPMQKWKRDQLVEILSQWIDLLEQALTVRAGLPAMSAPVRTLSSGRSSRDLMEALQNLKKARAYAQGNVSPAAICGWLEWALR